MKIKTLTTTILSLSLLTSTILAGTVDCPTCVVDFSTLSKKEVKTEPIRMFSEKTLVEATKVVMMDGIETISLPHEKFVMTQNEIAEYDLQHMQEYLTNSILEENSYQSDENCDDERALVYNVALQILECT